MTDVEERLATLERRVRQLEDEREIAHLIAGYGPLADAGAAEEVAAIWTEDGIYDVDEVYLAGRFAIRQMVESTVHRDFIEGGCAHVVGPPRVTVDGDEAMAVCHSLMIVHTGEGFVVRRATANHWQLRRTPDGWRTSVRTSRVLDGRPDSPDLLGKGARGQRP